MMYNLAPTGGHKCFLRSSMVMLQLGERLQVPCLPTKKADTAEYLMEKVSAVLILCTPKQGC
jgi:hypothetical protein